MDSIQLLLIEMSVALGGPGTPANLLVERADLLVRAAEAIITIDIIQGRYTPA